MINLLAAIISLLTSIYSLNFERTDGVKIDMEQFRGKKIMLVNIATGSNRVAQLSALQQLQQQYADSVVILLFPSNSFGNEERDDQQIKTFCEERNVNLLIAKKKPVTGDESQPLYKWLLTKSENGITSVSIVRDFQKVLIDERGEILGVFAPAIDPMDQLILNAISISGANQ